MCDRCAEGLTFFGLAEPQEPMLESYAVALRRGWSPNNVRDVSAEQLAALTVDPTGFLAGLLDQQGTVTLGDGTIVPRIPFFVRWMWDGEFCGAISLRYLPGTTALPPHVGGHIGYAVVPWKRSHGYASKALQLVLQEARELGLPHVEITTQPGNMASRIVVERNGGVRSGTWSHPTVDGGRALERYVVGVSGE